MARTYKPREFTVFFSNVPYTTSAGYLRKTFSKVGDVEYIELFTNSGGRSIGAGIATFASSESAKRAVSEMDGEEVDGRPIAVKENERETQPKGQGKGNPAARVFFNGVPYTTTEGFLRTKFEGHGKIVDFDFWRRPDGSSQGMGTCCYSEPSEADAAIAALSGAEVDGRSILVQKDDKPEVPAWQAKEDAGENSKGKGSKGGSKGAPGGKGKGSAFGSRRVFWSGVPASTTEGYLRARFERVGTITDFDFWRKEDGTSLGMGTCEFDHYLGATRALERLHEMSIDGGTMLIKMDSGGKGGSKGKGKFGGKGKAKGKYW
eukprot:gb/GFBE01030555.1/.p1 GENE.gb/GFBE01030555.1/~~gb/GFBE01030555.1/.p1  ORF type:complete len:319 (+),score=80.51 gb/GFBE01030555.1/:1-957(+)